MSSTGGSWIELLLLQDLTASELNGFYVGDSTNATDAKNGAYKFQNMAGIAATFKAGTIIVVAGGGAGLASDTSYNPTGGNWNLVLLTTNATYLTRTSAVDADIAGADVIWVDTSGSGTTISTDGFSVAYPATGLGTFGLNSNVQMAAPGNNRGNRLTGATTPSGAWVATNWTTSVTGGNLTAGANNGGNNATLISNTQTNPDTNPPTVTSIARQSPTAATTNVASVTYRVTFSEQLNALTVQSSDFTLTDVTGSITGESITSIAQGANSSIWDVTVSTGSGNGTLRLDVLAAATLLDLNGRDYAANYAAGDSFALDRTAPTVTGITRAGTSPTNASSVQYNIAFSESVSGLTAANLSLTSSGLIGSSITDVSGSGTAWTVTVSSGSGTGTLRLDLLNSTNLLDSAGNATSNVPYTSGELYQIDTVPPSGALTSSVSATNATPVNFTLSFTELVTGLDSTDFNVVNGSVSAVSGSGAGPYTVQVTPQAQGSVNLTLNAGAVQDLSGNPNAATLPVEVLFDSIQPDVTLSSSVPAATNNGFAVSFDFTESINGLDMNDLQIVNGMSFGIAGSGAGPYSLFIFPIGEGPVSIQIPAGVVQDDAGNLNTASNLISTVYDTQPPALVNRTPEAGSIVNNLVSVTVNLTEPVTGIAATALNVNGSPATSVSGSDAGPYVFSGFDQPADSTVTLQLAGSGIMDAAGNGLADVNWLIVKDSAGIQVTISSPDVVDGADTSKTTLRMNVDFAQSVTSFTLAALQLQNATADNLTTSGATASFDLHPSGEGAVSVNIPAGVVAGAIAPYNPNVSSNVFTFNYDGTAPTAVLASSAGSVVNTSFTIQLTFSEAMTGVDISQFDVTNAVLTGFSGSGNAYSATVEPQSEGTVEITYAAGSAADAAGNRNIISNTVSVQYDVTPPALTVFSSLPDPTNVSVMSFIFQFSEDVTGFSSADVNVQNATIIGFGQSNSFTYEIVVTPTLQETDVAVSVPAGAAQDIAGNLSPESNTCTRHYDGVAPTVAVGLPSPALTNHGPVEFMAQLSGASSYNLTPDDVELLTSGSAYAEIIVINGTTSTPTIHLNNIIGDGALSIRIKPDVLHDFAGNGNGSASAPGMVQVDNTPPALILFQNNAAATTNSTVLRYTLTFSEAIVGFDDVNDLQIQSTSVTLGTVAIDGGPTTYSVTLSGLAQSGLVRLGISAASDLTDLAGNPLGGTIESDPILIDQTPPAIAGTAPVRSAQIGNLPQVSVTFAEPVTGIHASDLTVNGSPATNVSGTAEGPYIFTGYNPPGVGEISIALASGATIDEVGNAFAGDSWSYMLVANLIDVTLHSATVADGAITNVDPIVVDITFSAPVTGFLATDLELPGAQINSFSGSGANYTVSFTPLQQGPISIRVPFNVCNAISAPFAANADSAALHFTYDTIAPTLQQALVQDNMRLIATFSEAITSQTALNPALWSLTGPGRGTLAQTPDSVQRISTGVYRLTWVTGEMLQGGALNLAVSGVHDRAGNPLGMPNSADIAGGGQGTPPTVSIEPVVPANRNRGLERLTITFSEPVSGFNSAALTLLRNTRTQDLGGIVLTPLTDRSYSAELTSFNSGNGQFSLRVNASAGIQDAAGNPLAASASVVWTITNHTAAREWATYE